MVKRLLVGLVLSAATLFTVTGAQAAPVTLFDDALQNSATFSAPAKASLDTTTVFAGTTSTKYVPTASFDQVGYAVGNAPAVPVDAPIYEVSIYIADSDPTPTLVNGIISQFILQTSGSAGAGTPNFAAVNFNNSNGATHWTLDGGNGTTTFTTNTWHTARFNLAAAFPTFVFGVQKMNLLNVQTNGSAPASQRVLYMDSASYASAVAVPEPTTAAVLSAVAVLGLLRRRNLRGDSPAV